MVRKIAPLARNFDSSGGSIVFSIPITDINDIVPFLKLIKITNENQEETNFKGDLLTLSRMISNCEVSLTTLEEVFMKVTGKDVI